MVDTAVLGHLDSAVYLAGVALAGAVFSLIFMGMNFLRMGTTGITAQALGRQDALAIRLGLWQAIVVAVLIAAVLIALQVPIGTLAWSLLDGSAATEHEAHIYFSIRIYSAPATLVNFALIGWFIGLQRSRAPLLIVVVSNVTNIILDIVFVVVLDMTTNGVALASVIGELAGCATGLLLANRALKRWPSSVSMTELTTPKRYGEFFSVNSNILIRTLALVGTLSFMTAQGARFGERVIAANAILMNLQYLLSYGLDGLAHAAEALVGKAWGAGNRAALTRAVNLTLVWSLAIAVGFSLTFAIGGDDIIGVLTKLPDVRQAAAVYLPWLIASPLISVFSFVFDGVFVGTTWSRDMRNLMLAASLLVFLPAWWTTLAWGNHGLWFAFTLFMAARGVLMGATYYRRMAASSFR